MNRNRDMHDVIGYGPEGYTNIVGTDGGHPPPGVPPYGYGWPAGNAYWPMGWPTPDPRAVMAVQAQQRAAMGLTIEEPSGRGWGEAPSAPVMSYGGVNAALATQQVKQELLGLEEEPLTALRTEYVGLGSACIGPCDSVTLRCCPCVLMKIFKICIPSSVAFQLEVEQITINGKTTLINCGPVSAAMFIETATIGEALATVTVQRGCCIEITLRNISKADVDVTVSGMCRVAYSC